MARMIVGICAFVGVLLGMALVASACDAKKKLEGEWEIVSIKKGAENAPDDLVKNSFFRITADSIKVMMKSGDQVVEKHALTYRIVNDKDIDLFKGDGEKKDVKHGIYELKDGQLKLAIFEGPVRDENGNIAEKTGRPKNFDETPSQLNIVLKLKK